jgi:rRNA-processing protein FCF1
MLREHATAAQAVTALNEAENKIAEALVPPPGNTMSATYALAVNHAEGRLGNAFDKVSIVEALQTRRYWHITENAPYNGPAPNFAVSQETAFITALLQKERAAFEALHAWLDGAGLFTIIDTNVLMHCVPINHIDWNTELKQIAGQRAQPRLIVPLAVVRELDRKKFEGADSSRRRAQKAIKSLHDLRGGCEPDEAARVAAAGGSIATLEIPRDDIGRTPLSNTDDELISYGQFMSFVGARPVAVVTRDLNVQIKAARAGLHVVWLSDAYLKDKVAVEGDSDE